MNSLFRELAAELHADIRGPKAVPSLSAGIISGLNLLVAELAFAAFIFSGPLAPYMSQGIGLVLFGNFAACLVIALLSGFRGVISGLSPAMVIVMALIVSTIGVEGYAGFVTAVGALVLSAVITGAGCFWLGYFRLTNLVRFIPYPVAGGFVAGIGGAVCLAAMSQMGAELDWKTLPRLLEPAMFGRWAPGVLYGVALYWVMKRWSHVIILPVSILLAGAAYHLALSGLGITGEEARAAGLLFTSTSEGGLWPPLGVGDLAYLDWAALVQQIPNMLTLMLVAFICVIMNIAGLELVANQDFDWDREFRGTGFAIMVAGLGGGTSANMIVPSSLRSKLLGADTRLTGVVAALVVGSVLLVGDGILEWTPVPLLGGILIFAGIAMLDEGLVRRRGQLPRAEFAILVLITVTIIVFGLLEGVGVGMVATLAFFVVHFSRVDPIESRFTLREQRSRKARPVPDHAILRDAGERMHAYRLRGYLFFGSICPLTEDLRQSLGDAKRPVCLLLDFAHVTGFDASALHVLSRFLQNVHAAGVQVVVSALSEPLREGLERNLPPAVRTVLPVEPDMDQALERCEELVIAAWRTDVDTSGMQRTTLLESAGEELERYLDWQARFEDLVAELQPLAMSRQYTAGETLTGKESPVDDLQLLLEGRASAYNSTGMRLYQCGPGDAIGPGGAKDVNTAYVVADEPCTTMVLTLAACEQLEEEHVQLALKLYRYLLDGHFRAGSASNDPTM
ncbi:MAG: SulP family inorganic anion transporter [Gammaproteobacteria bacterium]|nr:SulP family inorganic anion transporter [Gammaproteobacteria bacterium]